MLRRIPLRLGLPVVLSLALLPAAVFAQSEDAPSVGSRPPRSRAEENTGETCESHYRRRCEAGGAVEFRYSGSARGRHSVRSARPAGIIHGQYRQLFSGTRRQGSKRFEGSDRIESPDKTSPGRCRPTSARTIAGTGQVLFEYRLRPRYGRQSESGDPKAAGQRQAAGTRTFEDPPGGIAADRERFHEHPAETVVPSLEYSIRPLVVRNAANQSHEFAG